MHTKKNRGAWRLRWGIAALAAIAPFAVPAAASAATPTATGESIQYVNVTVNPPAGTQTAQYSNSVTSDNTKNGRSPFAFKYRLWNSKAPLVTATNNAEASVSACSHCGATAIAFQVVLVSKQTLAELNATDTAAGTTNACTTCNSLAEAFQIVYATSNPSLMTTVVTYAANQTARELQQLQHSGLSTTQIQSRSTTQVNNLIKLLQASSGNQGGFGGSAWSPAVNGAGHSAALTGTTAPIIDLLSQIHH
jgi:hypothetical protein